MYTWVKNIVFIAMILLVIYFIATTIFFNVRKEQICVFVNPTGQISNAEVAFLNNISSNYNTTIWDKYIIKPGIKLEIWRNSLSINRWFWMKC